MHGPVGLGSSADSNPRQATPRAKRKRPSLAPWGCRPGRSCRESSRGRDAQRPGPFFGRIPGPSARPPHPPNGKAPGPYWMDPRLRSANAASSGKGLWTQHHYSRHPAKGFFHQESPSRPALVNALVGTSTPGPSPFPAWLTPPTKKVKPQAHQNGPEAPVRPTRGRSTVRAVPAGGGSFLRSSST